MKEGEDAYGRIGEALNGTHAVQCLTTCRVSTSKSPNAVPGSLPHKNSANPCTSEPQATGDVSGIKSASYSSASDLQVPSDLIASCVATLLMIQVLLLCIHGLTKCDKFLPGSCSFLFFMMSIVANSSYI